MRTRNLHLLPLIQHTFSQRIRQSRTSPPSHRQPTTDNRPKRRSTILHARITRSTKSNRVRIRSNKTNQRKNKISRKHEPSNRKNRTHNNGRNLPLLPRRIPTRLRQKMLRCPKRKTFQRFGPSKRNKPNSKTQMRRIMHRNKTRRNYTTSRPKHSKIRSNTSRARSPSNRRRNLQKSKPRSHSPRCNRCNSKTKTSRLQNRIPPNARHPRHKSKERHQDVQRNILLNKIQTRPNQNLPMPSPKRCRHRKPILRRRIHSIHKRTSYRTYNRDAKNDSALLPNHANHARNPTTLSSRRNQKHRHASRHRKTNQTKEHKDKRNKIPRNRLRSSRQEKNKHRPKTKNNKIQSLKRKRILHRNNQQRQHPIRTT